MTYLRQSLATAIPLALCDFILAYLISSTFYSISGQGHIAIATAPTRFAIEVLLLYSCFGLYPGIGVNPVEEFRRLTLAGLAGAVLCMIPQMLGFNHDATIPCVGAWLMLLISAPVWRRVTRLFFSRFNWWCQPVLILGETDQAATIRKRLSSNRTLALRPADDVQDSSAGLRCFWVAASSCLQGRGVILQRILELRIPHIIWVRAQDDRILPNNIRVCTNEFEDVRRNPLRHFGMAAKRCFDFTVALTGGILLLPLLIVLAIAVKLTSKGPIFYGTPRLGMNNTRYRMWKFRSMVPDAEARLRQYLIDHPEERPDFEKYFKLKKDPRITPIGKWLRNLSLDELPQIWNVIAGDMSLVGPRPVDVGSGRKAAPLSTSSDVPANNVPVIAGLYHEKALQVRPGITGLWQISGRADTSQHERMDLDCEYVDHHSLWLDFYILMCTPAVILQWKALVEQSSFRPSSKTVPPELTYCVLQSG